jgi:hypothetical protein
MASAAQSHEAALVTCTARITLDVDQPFRMLIEPLRYPPHVVDGMACPVSAHFTTQVMRHFIAARTGAGDRLRQGHNLDYAHISTTPLRLVTAMVDQQIGLEETDDGIWAIHFSGVLLATFDERDYIITG